MVYDLIRAFARPVVVWLFRARAFDIHNVPATGAAILAPNHFSYMDHFFAAVPLRRRVQFMAKSQLFTGVMGRVYSHGGVFPVRRGQRDEDAFATANAVLERGGLVLMYAEGGRSRTGALGRPRSGVGRLALETGLVVVPTAIVGSARIRQWRRLRFPRVTVRYGEPMSFDRVEAPSREQAQDASEAIFARVRAMYDELEAAPPASPARTPRHSRP